MIQPLVSVIMNCYNGEAYLRPAIESVLAQTYSNWEIVLWDNQSKDSSPEITKSYGDPRIKYFRAEEFTSLGEARNRAIQKAQGEFIAFLDVDDIWFPEKLAKQITLFSDPDVGIVICDTIFFNKDGDFKQLYKSKKPLTGDVFRELLRAYYISLETVVIRRDHLLKLSHWFDNRFSMIEEMDLLVRLSAICKLAYVDEPLAKWRMHEKSWTFEKRSQFPVERRQMISTYKSHFPDFEKNFSHEIKAIEKTAALEESIVAFQKNDKSVGRSKINRFIFQDLKYTTYYFLSFLPNSLFLGILKKRGLIV